MARGGRQLLDAVDQEGTDVVIPPSSRLIKMSAIGGMPADPDRFAVSSPSINME
jgi:hypothetical protein